MVSLELTRQSSSSNSSGSSGVVLCCRSGLGWAALLVGVTDVDAGAIPNLVNVGIVGGIIKDQ